MRKKKRNFKQLKKMDNDNEPESDFLEEADEKYEEYLTELINS